MRCIPDPETYLLDARPANHPQLITRGTEIYAPRLDSANSAEFLRVFAIKGASREYMYYLSLRFPLRVIRMRGKTVKRVNRFYNIVPM